MLQSGRLTILCPFVMLPVSEEVRAMRIAVAGKGGAGKTTISATMARLFAQRGFRVNALDDDPNPNLANALGLTTSQVEQLRGIAREDIMEERVDANNHASLYLTIPFEQVIDD